MMLADAKTPADSIIVSRDPDVFDGLVTIEIQGDGAEVVCLTNENALLFAHEIIRIAKDNK